MTNDRKVANAARESERENVMLSWSLRMGKEKR